MWFMIAMVLALLAGIYIGLGFPGIKGREDRVVSRRAQRRHHFTPIDMLRPRKRQR